MRKALSEFNEKRKRDHLFTVENGIGLATGIVIQGSIGSHKHRVDLTVIGDTVNLSARLEAMSKDGNHTKIILSEETLKPLIDLVEVEALGAKLVKGKNQSVQVYELIAWKNSEQTNTNWDS
jgi:adenylate cyclase